MCLCSINQLALVLNRSVGLETNVTLVDGRQLHRLTEDRLALCL
jgi:hypothetical protein